MSLASWIGEDGKTHFWRYVRPALRQLAGRRRGQRLAASTSGVQPANGSSTARSSWSPRAAASRQFIGFLSEREAAGSHGASWLFFGNRYRDGDFLYGERLQTTGFGTGCFGGWIPPSPVILTMAPMCRSG